MEPIIHTRNLKMTPRLREYVEKKTERLDRYLPDLAEVRVELSTENARNTMERQVAQMTLRDSHGTILRAEERSNEIMAAVDCVVDKLYRQIKRYRGKQRRWRRTAAAARSMQQFEPLPGEEADEDEEAAPRILRNKQFPINPMSAEEAIDQMELLGHNFFMFFNSDDDVINVVYKRRDNTYGLIQPE